MHRLQVPNEMHLGTKAGKPEVHVCVPLTQCVLSHSNKNFVSILTKKRQKKTKTKHQKKNLYV